MGERAFSEYPAELRAAVEAYDLCRCTSYGRTNVRPMSDANKATIAPMIMAACRAYIEASIPPEDR